MSIMRVRIEEYLGKMKGYLFVIIFFWVAVVSFYFAIWFDDGSKWFWNGLLSLILAVMLNEEEKNNKEM